MGIIGNDRNANTLPAQCGPRFLYICCVNRGNTAPKIYRSTPFAARAVLSTSVTNAGFRKTEGSPDAAAPLWYISTRNVMVERNRVKAPRPNGIPAATKAAQCPPRCGSQAYLCELAGELGLRGLDILPEQSRGQKNAANHGGIQSMLRSR